MENVLRLFEDRLDKLRPETIFRTLNNFEEPKLRERYVNTMLK